MYATSTMHRALGVAVFLTMLFGLTAVFALVMLL